MNFLLKNRETLALLFNSFSLQEIMQVNHNLNESWHLLITPPEQLLTAMNEKQVSIESFLGKKCLPLIRFYLAEQALQKETFLSTDLLAALFTSLPAVEAMVFKEQIYSAQLSVQKNNHALSCLLSGEALQPLPVDNSEAIVQLKKYQSASKQSLALLSESDKQYLNCFYYLNAGDLFIVAEGQSVDSDMLLYSELSPLQQLQAQKLFKISSKELDCQRESIESMAQQSASA